MNTMEKPLNILNVWKRVLNFIKKYPNIIVPFICVAVFDYIFLTVIYLIPRPPLSYVFAPIIKAFFGEKFLHYPINFFIIPKLFNYAKNASGFIIGVLFTGIAISFLHQIEHDCIPQWDYGVRQTLKRFARLMAVWGIMILSFFIVTKAFAYFTPFIHSKELIFGIKFFINMFIQMVFVFTMPGIIIENRKVYASIIRSMAILKKHPFVTFLLVTVPGMLMVPSTYLYVKIPVLMSRTFPEITLYIMGAQILILNIIDLIITLSATVMLLMYRKKYSSSYS
jgi:hypothetical protein